MIIAALKWLEKEKNYYKRRGREKDYKKRRDKSKKYEKSYVILLKEVKR